MAIKFAEKFLNMMTLNDVDDEYDEYDDEYEEVNDGYEDDYDEDDEYEYDDYQDSKTKRNSGIKKPTLSFRHRTKNIEEDREESRTHQESNSDRVLQFHSRREGDLEVVKVVKPQEFNDAQIIVDHLRDGKTIVVNLEGIEISQAQRIIDFVGGASFIIDGSLKAISNNIFIVAPNSIEVSGDLKSEIVNEAMLSPELGTI